MVGYRRFLSEKDSPLHKKYMEYRDHIEEWGNELDAAKGAFKDAEEADAYASIALFTIAAILAADRLAFETEEVIPDSDPDDEERIKDAILFAGECYDFARSCAEKASEVAVEVFDDSFDPPEIAEAYDGIAIAWSHIQDGSESLEKAYRQHEHLFNKRGPRRR